MTGTKSKLETTIGELVTARPARARIFESFGIDYCCGGKKPLAAAIREKNLDETAVLGVLDAFDDQAPQQEPDLSTLTMTELADHIEATHHAYLKAELPRLEFLVNKVANTGPEIQDRGIVGPEPEKVRRQKPGADDSQMTLF